MQNSAHFADAHEAVRTAVSLIRASRFLTAFSGAGISVESGIPPFRGEGGLWNTYDPNTLGLEYFQANPERAWPILKEIFYEHFEKAKPNRAHEVLARLEIEGWPQDGADGGRARLQVLITQNVDNLHFKAGSRNIIEFHGNSRQLTCLSCEVRVDVTAQLLEKLPPRCSCGGLLKPGMVFFGELIPPAALAGAEKAALQTDVMLVVGSTGEVYPAAQVPIRASQRGTKIIEINPRESEFTSSITDIYIPLAASEALGLIEKELFS
jgi:NAD-dependent deacetylase